MAYKINGMDIEDYIKIKTDKAFQSGIVIGLVIMTIIFWILTEIHYMLYGCR